MAIAGAGRGLIYTLRSLMGLEYAGGQDDVLRAIDLVFYTVVGLGIVLVVLFLLRR